MRHFLLYFLLFLGGWATGLAQTRPDLIYRLDQTSLSVFVDEIGENDITYFLPSDNQKKQLQRINKAQVWKVVFSNGDTELFNEPRQVAMPPDTPQKVVTTTSTDRIFLKNKTIVEGSITKVTEKNIEYRRAGAAPNSPVYELSRDKIQKIEYENGEIESFAKISAKPTEMARTEKGKTNKSKGTSKKPTSKPALTKPKQEVVVKKESKTPSVKVDKTSKRRFSFTVGPEVAYVIGDKEWVNEQDGIGMGVGVGASASLTAHIKPWLAVTASGGILQWEIERNFKDSVSQNLLLRRNNLIKLIPITAGLKIYPLKGFYISPQATYTIYQEQGIDFDPVTETTTPFLNFKGNKLGYKGEIGYDARLKNLSLQISAYYTTLIIQDLNEFKNVSPLSFVGARIAIGFGK